MQAAAPPLRIVVIEGEGAVNIIQQKTAVAPVIEVRDRNDQPVAGATVNFVVRGGRAAFSGARTLTVTTNAAGRAAAAGFTPSGTGALQIGATATFQGQTAAAVTIAQTNVMTAAEAAALSSASAGGSGGGAAGGAGAGGGGGLSTTTLAVIGGAVAGGAIVAKETVFSGLVFEGRFSGVLPHSNSGVPGVIPCAVNEAQTGTLRMEFDTTDGSVRGVMSVDDTEIQISPGTCATGSGRDHFPMEGGTVTGTRDNLTGTGRHENDYTSTNPPGGGVNAYDFTFTGRFESDEQISGSLTVVRTVTFRSNDGVISNRTGGAVTHQVVLKKK